MSRHRNVRSMNYEDEYFDDEDDYSRSYEDNYCISPGTVAQFTWSREKNSNLASYMGEDQVINEEAEEEDGDQDASSSLHDSFKVREARSNLSDVDQARLNSCLEEIHNIMGETVPESFMVDAVLRNQFSVEKSLNELLSQQDAPKPQRQPRNRNRSQDDSDDTNELDKLLADIQSLESVTNPEYHTPALLRFKSNPGNDNVDSHFGAEASLLEKDLVCAGTGLLEKDLVCAGTGDAVCSSSSSSVLVQKENHAIPRLPKSNISLADLAKQSSSRNEKESCNNSKVETTKVNLNNPCHSHSAKPSDSGKVSLADLAKLSNREKRTKIQLNKEAQLDSSVSDLGRSLSKNLTVDSSRGGGRSEGGKLSLADLAKQHKTIGEGGHEHNDNRKLGDSLSAYIGGHRSAGDKDKKSLDPKQALHNKPMAPTLSDKGQKSSSKASLSELANRHKSNLQSSLGALKKDSKLSSLHVQSESKKPSGFQTAGGSSKQISGINSAEKSLAKLSLTSCLRSCKQTTGPLVVGKTVTSPECLGDLTDVISSVDNFKENKDFISVGAVESIDSSLLPSPSNSAVVFCEVFVAKQTPNSHVGGVKRKMKFPSFSCQSQVKKIKILYPQEELHPLSAFKFSTLSPDDIVKNKQKQAFMRSDKEFTIGHS